MRNKLIVPRTAEDLAQVVARFNAINKTDLELNSRSVHAIEEEQYRKRREDTLMQMIADISLLALHDEFGMAESRLVRFHDAFVRRWNWMIDIARSDLDSEVPNDLVEPLAVTKTRIDEMLRGILGEHFEEWNERYCL